MRSIRTDAELSFLEERVLHYAEAFGRTLPEMRFFILTDEEFASLLAKRVYPTAPVNIWEGKEMVNRRLRVESGQEAGLYYEVVQTGRPSYAYLNDTNSAMMQATVMAHVVGHCEFSELNVMHDSNDDRTEWVMHLVRKVNLGRQQLGEVAYRSYWNACESVVPLIHPNSQYNLENSVDLEDRFSKASDSRKETDKKKPAAMPFSTALDQMLKQPMEKTTDVVTKEIRKKEQLQTMSRQGYKLRAPCQDVLGFLKAFAPATRAEKAILNYMYEINRTREFIMKTQIMNEGWAMYWEKKIMLELFREKACVGIIDYAKAFSGVCYPRPWFQRNPYHLGYHLWNHIEQLYKDGKVSLDFVEETDVETRRKWHKPPPATPLECMEHLVETVTDYEFLRRFLTPQLVTEFHLNRIDKRMAGQLGLQPKDVIKEDRRWVWLEPEPIIPEMLQFFTHFYQPRIYIIDDDFMDGGLLLLHRDDGRELRKDWIYPTLKNVNLVWKGPVCLISGTKFYRFTAGKMKEETISEVHFDDVAQRMQNGEKAFKL